MIKEFKDFVMRGNVVDLAVAVVVGAAFGAVVTSFVDDLIMPVVAMIFGEPDFSNLTFTINDSVFRYGNFLTVALTFVLIAAAVFFVVVKPMTEIMQRRKASEEATERECPECLSEIPVKASRCAFCTAEVPPVTT